VLAYSLPPCRQNAASDTAAFASLRMLGSRSAAVQVPALSSHQQLRGADERVRDSKTLEQRAYVSEKLSQKQIRAVHHDEVVAAFEAHKALVGC
jgi:hypothetical protein